MKKKRTIMTHDGKTPEARVQEVKVLEGVVLEEKAIEEVISEVKTKVSAQKKPSLLSGYQALLLAQFMTNLEFRQKFVDRSQSMSGINMTTKAPILPQIPRKTLKNQISNNRQRSKRKMKNIMMMNMTMIMLNHLQKE